MNANSGEVKIFHQRWKPMHCKTSFICFYKYVFAQTYERLRMRSNTQEIFKRAAKLRSTWHFWLPRVDSPECLFCQEIMITVVMAPARLCHPHFNLSNHGNLASGTARSFTVGLTTKHERARNTLPTAHWPWGKSGKCSLPATFLRPRQDFYLARQERMLIYLFISQHQRKSFLWGRSRRICKSYIIWRNLHGTTCSNLL